jgi:hypothetical protein
MSEVDRLSNSGLYPALPIADRRSRGSAQGGSAETPDKDKKDSDKESAAGAPRLPKSIIDEYA